MTFKILDQKEDVVQLQCEVVGTSSGLKLNISWWDSSKTILAEKGLNDTERGGTYILNTAVSKSGRYRCVATQEEINHQIYAENYVPVSGELYLYLYITPVVHVFSFLKRWKHLLML